MNIIKGYLLSSFASYLLFNEIGRRVKEEEFCSSRFTLPGERGKMGILKPSKMSCHVYHCEECVEQEALQFAARRTLKQPPIWLILSSPVLIRKLLFFKNLTLLFVMPFVTVWQVSSPYSWLRVQYGAIGFSCMHILTPIIYVLLPTTARQQNQLHKYKYCSVFFPLTIVLWSLEWSWEL